MKVYIAKEGMMIILIKLEENEGVDDFVGWLVGVRCTLMIKQVDHKGSL